MNPVSFYIVEDDPGIARELESYLLKQGYRVTGIMATGEQAVKSFQRKHADAVIMDIELSGEMTGIETAAMIRTIDQHIPILFLTRLIQRGIYEQAKKISNLFMAKPFNEFNVLERALEAVRTKAQNFGYSETAIQIEHDHRHLFYLEDERVVRFKAEDLLFIKSESQPEKVTKLYFEGADQSKKSKNYPKDFLEALHHLPYIKRVHNQYIVNLNKISELKLPYGLKINQSYIPVGGKFLANLEHHIAIIRRSR